MKCPIPINNCLHTQRCAASECAWWHDAKNCCAILSLADSASFRNIKEDRTQSMFENLLSLVKDFTDGPLKTNPSEVSFGKDSLIDNPETPFCNGCNHLHNTYCKKYIQTVMYKNPYRLTVCIEEGSYE